MSTAATETTTNTWSVDPVHSQAEFGVRHMMISTVKGYFDVEGTIHLDEDDFSASSIELTMDAASVNTRNEDRDAHLRSEDFFDAESHPVLKFKGSPEGPRGGDRFTVEGELTIRDVTRPVTLEAEELGRGTDPWGNPRVGFRGETRISRKDYGLTWNQALETGGVLVGDEVRIQVEVQAIPADAAQEG